MALHHSPKIVTSGLILSLDAKDINSYPDSGLTWYDLSSSQANAELPGSIIDGSNYLEFRNSSSSIGSLNTGSLETTMECWFYVPSGGSYSGCCETIFGKYYFRTFLIGQFLYTMIGFANTDGSFNTYQHPAYAIEYDTWIHTVGMRRGDRYIIWLNGVEVYNTGFGEGLQLYDTMGGLLISDPDHSLIRIGSARIYNRGLTDFELLQNYDAHKNRFGR
jgi:hypothetical protein